MAVECPFCQTSNRESAKFCKSCGGKLVAFPPASTPDEHTVIVAPSLRPAAPIERPLEPPSAASGLPSARWPLVVLVGLGVLVAAAAGGYFYLRDDAGPAPSPVVAAVAATPAAPAATQAEPAAAAASVPLGIPTDPSAVPAMPPPPPEPPAPAPEVVAARVAVDASSTPPPPKPRKTATPRAVASAPAPVPEPAPAIAPPPPVAAPASPPPAEPRTACAGRNFVAMAQCMAAQCVKAEFKPHPQCEAVRRQQRLEEERRNPTMMN